MTSLAAPVLIMTPFSLWRHSLLVLPRPPLRTYARTNTLPRLVYKDILVGAGGWVYLGRPKAEISQLRQFDEVACTGAGDPGEGEAEVLEAAERAAA